MYALIWKSNSFTVELTQWQTLIDTTLPQQITRTDCAVFSAMFALFKAYEIPFSLFNQDTNYWRRKLACDLLHDKFHVTTLQAKVRHISYFSFLHYFLVNRKTSAFYIPERKLECFKHINFVRPKITGYIQQNLFLIKETLFK